MAGSIRWPDWAKEARRQGRRIAKYDSNMLSDDLILRLIEEIPQFQIFSDPLLLRYFLEQYWHNILDGKIPSYFVDPKYSQITQNPDLLRAFVKVFDSINTDKLITTDVDMSVPAGKNWVPPERLNLDKVYGVWAFCTFFAAAYISYYEAVEAQKAVGKLVTREYTIYLQEEKSLSGTITRTRTYDKGLAGPLLVTAVNTSAPTKDLSFRMKDFQTGYSRSVARYRVAQHVMDPLITDVNYSWRWNLVDVSVPGHLELLSKIPKKYLDMITWPEHRQQAEVVERVVNA